VAEAHTSTLTPVENQMIKLVRRTSPDQD